MSPFDHAYTVPPTLPAVVVEHGVHPLLPLGALMHERVTAPNAGAQVQEVRGRDP